MRDKATKKMVQCEFPFKFKGEKYNGCIDFNDIQNGNKVPSSPWCSTKVQGSDREHVTGGGHYGDCNSFCPSAGDKVEPPTTTTSRPTNSTGDIIK